MSTEEKEKQTRTPRTYDSIEKGALSLGLSERVNLRNKLNDSIEKEVTDLQEMAKKAAEIAGK